MRLSTSPCAARESSGSAEATVQSAAARLAAPGRLDEPASGISSVNAQGFSFARRRTSSSSRGVDDVRLATTRTFVTGCMASLLGLDDLLGVGRGLLTLPHRGHVVQPERSISTWMRPAAACPAIAANAAALRSSPAV